MIYAAEMTLGEARALLFERGGFGADGGYDDRWIKVKVWRVPLWLPNTEGRRRDVKLHDLHHVLTEYPTTWRGEAEIAAWEMASGRPRSYAGWLLDTLGIAQGLVINPRGVYRAFVRGRHSSNLYFREFGEDLLSRRVGELRRQLRLDAAQTRAGLRDRLAFLYRACASVLVYLASVALALLPCALLAACVYRMSSG